MVGVRPPAKARHRGIILCCLPLSRSGEPFDSQYQTALDMLDSLTYRTGKVRYRRLEESSYTAIQSLLLADHAVVSLSYHYNLGAPYIMNVYVQLLSCLVEPQAQSTRMTAITASSSTGTTSNT